MDFTLLPVAGVGRLLEVQLDHAGVVVAVLHLGLLDDLGAQLAGQFAPGLAGVLLQLGTEQAQVGPAAGRDALVADLAALFVRLPRMLGLLRRLLGGLGHAWAACAIDAWALCG